ncbi:MAG: aminomethyltransferase family protein, partial [Nocardioides sp.]
LVLTAPACATRDLAWLRTAAAAQSAANPAAWASVTDVTGTLALVSVMGPRSRDLLAGLTDADLSDAAFPFGESREIDLGLGFVRATRITYVGELGWELLVPWELAEHVWDTVREAGARPCGYYALNSLRLEKAYRSWGHDITAGDTPLEAGLGFCVDWGKEFRGKAALAAQRAAGVERRLVQFVLADPEPLLLHDEPVWRDGELVGHIVSAGYGHSLGGAVGLGYVSAPVGTPRDWFTGDYEIEVACQRYAAHGSLRPAYDPGSERIRG